MLAFLKSADLARQGLSACLATKVCLVSLDRKDLLVAKA